MTKLRPGSKKLGLLLIVVVIAAPLTTYGLVRANQPTEGTIISRSAPASRPVAADKILTTAYYTTSYPSRYTLQPEPARSASLNAQVLIDRDGTRYGAGSRMTLTVTTAPAGGIQDDSTYKLFQSQPDIYHVSSLQAAGDRLVVAERSDTGYERLLLWPHGSYLLTITLIAPAATAITDSDLQTVIQHMKW